MDIPVHPFDEQLRPTEVLEPPYVARFRYGHAETQYTCKLKDDGMQFGDFIFAGGDAESFVMPDLAL
jgi:hypothetical protein